MTNGQLTATGGGYGPNGWMQWPDDPDFSFQFVRILAGAQDGASTIGECFQTAGRIGAGDWESWHVEWMKTGDASRRRAEDAEAKNFSLTAQSNWIRATNYYRSAEFFLDPRDPRRLTTFDIVEECSRRAMMLMQPIGEVVEIPFEDGHIDAYFLRTPIGNGPHPAIVAFGGLDEYKDELIQEMARYALPRGFSLLLVDLPGQGSALRRQGLIARYDMEVPVSACVDYLQARSDVDRDRIGLYGASMGGYYAGRVASFEHRLKCAVIDGAVWRLDTAAEELLNEPDGLIAMHAKWVFGVPTVEDLVSATRPFKLDGVAGKIRCPLLIVHGEMDLWGQDNATLLLDHTRRHGVDVDFKWFTVEETGAAHCQVDNPTLGMEYICDWIGRRLGTIDSA